MAAKDGVTSKRVTVTMPADARNKFENLKTQLEVDSYSLAIDRLIDLYLEGRLVDTTEVEVDTLKTQGVKEALRPIAEYLGLVFQRAGLTLEVDMIEAAIGIAAGTVPPTEAYFLFPLDLVDQVRNLREGGLLSKLESSREQEEG